MKNRHLLSYGAAWLAMCGTCLPTSLVMGNEVVTTPRTAETGSRSRTMIHDVALQPGGLLVGQIVDATMQPMRGTPVAIQANGQTTATTTTDANGVFAVAGLHGGVHQVVTGDSTEPCRLWAPGTAPPQAVSHLRFVPGQGHIVRGQWGPPPAYNSMKTWAIIGGVAVVAAGIPILMNNLDDDDGNGS